MLGQWRYDDSAEPVADRSGLEQPCPLFRLCSTTRTTASMICDSDDTTSFTVASVRRVVSGQRPQLWFVIIHAVSVPDRRLEKELDKVMRSRTLNPRWIEGCSSTGKGAFEMRRPGLPVRLRRPTASRTGATGTVRSLAGGSWEQTFLSDRNPGPAGCSRATARSVNEAYGLVPTRINLLC